MTFYDTVGEGVLGAAGFAAEGIALGERVIVVTAAARPALDGALVDLGLDPVSARESGRLVVLDATETLAGLLADGAVDAERFRSLITPLLAAARADGVRLRIFGEMVALLWQAGNVPGALELEGLWNELAQEKAFPLLCAYPSSALGTAHVGDVSDICAQHSEVLPPRRYAEARWRSDAPGLDRRAETFVPVPEAVSAVRRFVSGVLEDWDEDALVPDATLVISEMATNAVMHAGSAFRAYVERSGEVIRIAIEDAGSGMPESLALNGEDLNGRGVAIVEALSLRWGWDALASGKIVWAELCAARAASQVG